MDFRVIRQPGQLEAQSLPRPSDIWPKGDSLHASLPTRWRFTGLRVACAPRRTWTVGRQADKPTTSLPLVVLKQGAVANNARNQEQKPLLHAECQPTLKTLVRHLGGGKYSTCDPRPHSNIAGLGDHSSLSCLEGEGGSGKLCDPSFQALSSREAAATANTAAVYRAPLPGALRIRDGSPCSYIRMHRGKKRGFGSSPAPRLAIRSRANRSAGVIKRAWLSAARTCMLYKYLPPTIPARCGPFGARLIKICVA